MEITKILSDIDGEAKCREEYKALEHRVICSFTEVPFTTVARTGCYDIGIRLAKTINSFSWGYLVKIKGNGRGGDATISQKGGYASYGDALNAAITAAKYDHAEV